MKKVKTEHLVIHIEVDNVNGTKHIIAETAERGCYGRAIRFMIPDECSKKTISDTGLARHILNYFIKE